MLLLWFASALAAPCPDVSELLDDAWAAFDDAELVHSGEHLQRAVESLGCAERVVTKEELLELYRLQGLIALAREDKEGAVYATIRMVTIDPDAPPAPELGPEIAEMHETWSGRLSTRVSLSVVGSGEAWVDGTPIGGSDDPRVVVAGEHLIQARDDAGWHGVVREIGEDTRVLVGDGLVLEGLGTTTLPQPEPDGPPVILDPIKPPGPFQRKHRTSLLVGGGAGVAAGVGLVVGGFALEQQFKDDPYLDPAYNGCARTEPCYEAEREKAIRADAAVIRALYTSGYIVGGLGVVVLGMEVFLLPEPSGGGSVRLRGTW